MSLVLCQSAWKKPDSKGENTGTQGQAEAGNGERVRGTALELLAESSYTIHSSSHALQAVEINKDHPN